MSFGSDPFGGGSIGECLFILLLVINICVQDPISHAFWLFLLLVVVNASRCSGSYSPNLVAFFLCICCYNLKILLCVILFLLLLFGDVMYFTLLRMEA